MTEFNTRKAEVRFSDQETDFEWARSGEPEREQRYMIKAVRSKDHVLVRDGMKITFRTMSLPNARLVWHTAYIVLFYSPDRIPAGDEYKEYALIRLDGEDWESDGLSSNKAIVNKTDDFMGWDENGRKKTKKASTVLSHSKGMETRSLQLQKTMASA